MKDIIEQNRGLIKAIIKKLTGSYNEDIEQEVYIKTWRNMNHYKEQGKFSQWIGALTANVCRDYFKSRQYKIEAGQVGGDEILENVKQRDYIDQNREVSPLRKAEDALLLDNTDLSIEEQKKWLFEQFNKVSK